VFQYMFGNDIHFASRGNASITASKRRNRTNQGIVSLFFLLLLRINEKHTLDIAAVDALKNYVELFLLLIIIGLRPIIKK
jgi:hypothetical protein